MLDKITEMYTSQLKTPFKKGEMLFVSYAATAVDYFKSGVSTQAYFLSRNKVKEMGCILFFYSLFFVIIILINEDKGCVTISTNPITDILFLKEGGKVVCSLPLSEYQYEGEYIFQSIISNFFYCFIYSF